MCALTNPTSAAFIAAAGGTFEPQRSNNFSVEIALGAADRDIIVMSVHAMGLPKQGNETITIPFQNEQRKVAGQVTVDEGTITLRDYVDIDSRGAVMRWRKQVYDPKTGAIGLAKDYKKHAYLILHAPDGTSKRICKLIGCWPPADPTVDVSAETSDGLMMEVPLVIDSVDWSENIVGA